jgi:release factor glutamine methyltransferase
MPYMFSQEVNWLLKEKYQGEESAAFLADAALLKAGTPLAYLIGSIPFLNTTIYLDSHPLIPRPETEFWVEQAINTLNKQCSYLGHEPKNLHILDLCAGSGAIGVAVAKALPASLVDFVELDTTHLPTIAKNCRANDISPERVHIYASDLFLRPTGELLPRYDIILSNPPYIDKSLGRTETSVVDHEPALALYGGASGLEIITKIINDAPNHLKPNGQLWLEHEPEQVPDIGKLAAPHFLISTHKDQYGVPRYSFLVLQ